MGKLLGWRVVAHITNMTCQTKVDSKEISGELKESEVAVSKRIIINRMRYLNIILYDDVYPDMATRGGIP